MPLRPGSCSRRVLPVALVVVSVAFGTWLRTRGIGGLFLYGDELHSLPLSRASYGTILSSYDPLGSGIALPLLQRIAQDLFGPQLWAVRLPTLAAGVAGLVAMPVVARRLIGGPAACVATLALALSSLHVFHSHFARSYSLALLLGLVLVHAVARALETPAAARRWAAVAATCAALLPWVHLSAASLVVGVAIGAAAVLARERRGTAAWRALGLGCGAAALLAALLYAPASGPLLDFLAGKARSRPEVLGFGLFDLALRFAGSGVAAWVWLVLLPVSALWMLRARPRPALLVGAAAFTPLAILAVARPVGGVYAYARYLLPALPFLLMLPAWAVVEAGRRISRGNPLGEVGAVGAAGALVVAAFWAGPLDHANRAEGPFANMTHGLYVRERPAPVRVPAFYTGLADSDRPLRIVEAPAFFDWRLDLYRSYYLQHRQETWLGTLGSSPADPIRGPYASVRHPAQLHASGADYLILHLDPEAELQRARGEKGVAPVQPLAGSTVRALRLAIGRPVYEDEDILVFALGGAR
jgi:hypothetical protein